MSNGIVVIRNRSIALALFISFLILVASGALLVSWIFVPTLFPQWVVLHSPWVDPVIRACAAGDVGDEHVGMSRLAQFGTEAVSTILPYLKHSDAKRRRVAAVALGSIHDARGIDALIEVLNDPDDAVRSAAMRSINRLGPSPQQRERIWQMKMQGS